MISVSSTIPKQLFDDDARGSLSRMVTSILNNLYDSEYLTCKPTDVNVTLMESKVGQGTLVSLHTQFSEHPFN